MTIYWFLWATASLMDWCWHLTGVFVLRMRPEFPTCFPAAFSNCNLELDFFKVLNRVMSKSFFVESFLDVRCGRWVRSCEVFVSWRWSYLIASAYCFFGGAPRSPVLCTALYLPSVADRSSAIRNSASYSWRTSYFRALLVTSNGSLGGSRLDESSVRSPPLQQYERRAVLLACLGVANSFLLSSVLPWILPLFSWLYRLFWNFKSQ